MRSLGIGSLVLSLAWTLIAQANPPEAPRASAQQPKLAELAATRPARPIRLQLAIAEVSLQGMQRRDVTFAQFGLGQQTPPGTTAASRALTGQHQLRPEAVKVLIDSLSRQELLKIVASPILIVSDRQPGSYFLPGKNTTAKANPDGSPSVAERKIGTELQLTADTISDSQIVLKLHAIQTEAEPLVSIARRGGTAPAYRTREMNIPIEMKLGTTLVCGGLVREETMRDPRTRRYVPREIQTVLVITPELYDPAAGELASPPAKLDLKTK